MANLFTKKKISARVSKKHVHGLTFSICLKFTNFTEAFYCIELSLKINSRKKCLVISLNEYFPKETSTTAISSHR